MTTKTYRVMGLLEWKALIPVGTAMVRVTFSRGRMRGNGMFPAQFTTADPAIQTIIEHSGYFRTGRIVLESQQTVPDPDPGKRVLRSRPDDNAQPQTQDSNENPCQRTDPEGTPPDGGGPDEYNII